MSRICASNAHRRTSLARELTVSLDSPPMALLSGFEEADYSKYWEGRRIEDEAERKVIRRWLRPSDSCLELGGGFGRMTRILEPYFHNVAMVDLTRRNVMMAKGKLAKAEVLWSDVSKLPMRDSTFDTAIMIRVAHLLPDPGNVMREILRVVKDGGTLILSVRNLVVNRMMESLAASPRSTPASQTARKPAWPFGKRPYLDPSRYFVPSEFMLKERRGTGLFDNKLGRLLNGAPSLSWIDFATSRLWFFKLDVMLKFEISKHGDPARR